MYVQVYSPWHSDFSALATISLLESSKQLTSPAGLKVSLGLSPSHKSLPGFLPYVTLLMNTVKNVGQVKVISSSFKSHNSSGSMGIGIGRYS